MFGVPTIFNESLARSFATGKPVLRHLADHLADTARYMGMTLEDAVDRSRRAREAEAATKARRARYQRIHPPAPGMGRYFR
jgi:hypothetical protein